ncbi:unnamed protein product [Pedinophyceae sp. YPF-701]|nr:unnamed protein product [Pedinophyceae sp. YPF-701]
MRRINSKKQRKREARQGKRHRGKAKQPWENEDEDPANVENIHEEPAANATRDAGAAGGEEPQTEEPADAEEKPAPQPRSKSQQRKLRQVEERKRKREEREIVVADIQRHTLDEDKLKLLRSVGARSAKETKRERARRALLMERAGLHEEAERLGLYQRPKRRRAEPSSDEGGGSGEDDAAQQRDTGSESGGSEGGQSGSESEDGDGVPPTGIGVLAPKAADAGASESGDDIEDDGEPALGAAALRKRRKEATLKELASDGLLDRTEGEEDAAGVFSGTRLEDTGVPVDDPILALTRNVGVERTEEVQRVREGLPIVAMEAEVVDAIRRHDVLILCGETGCGKTTQVPQFLHEAGFGCGDFPERRGRIGVTQPRRVAAVSTAQRVAEELGGHVGARKGAVGYQIRHDRRVSEDTSVKFMTDGILLREIQDDFLLAAYSCVVVDEAHERSLNTDVLLGLLSRVVRLRRSKWEATRDLAEGSPAKVYPLRLVIMSATLRAEDFTSNRRIFRTPPPILHVPARQFPVTVHFSRRTELHDYASAAFRKVCRIHRELPHGGILVFLTGQREVELLCRRLRKAFPARTGRPEPAEPHGSDAEDEVAGEQFGADVGEREGAGGVGRDDEVAFEGVDDFEVGEADEDEEEVEILGGGVLDAKEVAEAEARMDEAMARQFRGEGVFKNLLGERGAADEAAAAGGGDDVGYGAGASAWTAAGWLADEAAKGFTGQLNAQAGTEVDGAGGDDDAGGHGHLHVLPLYAMLPQRRQAACFEPPPPGSRLVVVATNVAETSLTIPGIRYVVDAGRSKQKLLERSAGLARYDVRWVSKASAQQRAGRAGRTGPGHCYRLYSSAHFADTFPEHTPPEIANTPLEGVVLMLKSMGVENVANFPFPTPPDADALGAAEACLRALSAIDARRGTLTALGKAMSAFPISPRHSRMLLEAASARTESVDAPGTRSTGAGEAVGFMSADNAAEVLPFAVMLAAGLSVDTPFLHVDSIRAEDDDASSGDEGDASGEHARRKKGVSAATKAKRARAREAQAAFRCGNSDALSVLRALCAYELGGESDRWCKEHFMHGRNLREAAALHRQLARSLTASGGFVRRVGGSGAAAQAWADAARRVAAAAASATVAEPPAAWVEGRLRRAIAAGWADRTGRRVRTAEYLARMQDAAAEAAGRLKAVRYDSCAMGAEEHVYLHPNSVLARRPPAYAVCLELVRGPKRVYMGGVTAIEPEWLPAAAPALCRVSKPLEDPVPFYSPERDEVLAWHDVEFGPHNWQLPRHPARHPSQDARCAAFAVALLSGKVTAAFTALSGSLVAKPDVIQRPEMQGHVRVGELVARLTAAKVDSRRALAAAWSKAPQFLLREIAQWVPKSHASVLEGLWPAATATCIQEAADGTRPGSAPGGKSKGAKRAMEVASRGAASALLGNKAVRRMAAGAPAGGKPGKAGGRSFKL